MSTVAHLAALQRLQVPAVTTADAAAVLGLSVSAVSHALRTLAEAGRVVPVRKGLWSLERPADPMRMLEYVTAPYPAYVSLQTALYLHGMVEQIPVVTYAVTLGRSSRPRTAAGAYSLHRVAPKFFDGVVMHAGGFKLATPEKALVDLFYLASTRGRAFASLPEVERPKGFRRPRRSSRADGAVRPIATRGSANYRSSSGQSQARIVRTACRADGYY